MTKDQKHMKLVKTRTTIVVTVSWTQVFVVIILLIGYLDMVDMTKNEYDVLELYAGQQRLVKLAKGLKMKTAAMDRDFDTLGDNKSKNNAMDMNTSGGFVFLHPLLKRVWPWNLLLIIKMIYCTGTCISKSK